MNSDSIIEEIRQVVYCSKNALGTERIHNFNFNTLIPRSKTIHNNSACAVRETQKQSNVNITKAWNKMSETASLGQN